MFLFLFQFLKLLLLLFQCTLLPQHGKIPAAYLHRANQEAREMETDELTIKKDTVLPWLVLCVILGTGRSLVQFPEGDMQEAECGASTEDTHHVWQWEGSRDAGRPSQIWAPISVCNWTKASTFPCRTCGQLDVEMYVLQMELCSPQIRSWKS